MSRSRPRVVSRCSFQTALCIVEPEQALSVEAPAVAELPFDATRHVDDDAPSRRAPRPADGHRRPHAADAALAVGHACRPSRPRSWPATAGRRRRRSRSSRRPPARPRTRSARVRGAPSPGRASTAPGSCRRSTSSLDLAIGCGLEHLDRRLAGRGRHVVDAPERGHFGAVLGVAEVAMRRQQVGHAADLAAAHRVRLAGQRERAGAWLADLPASPRCRLISAAFFIVPLVLWFRPWQ